MAYVEQNKQKEVYAVATSWCRTKYLRHLTLSFIMSLIFIPCTMITKCNKFRL